MHSKHFVVKGQGSFKNRTFAKIDIAPLHPLLMSGSNYRHIYDSFISGDDIYDDRGFRLVINEFQNYD